VSQFDEMGVHFSRLPSFSLSQILSVATVLKTLTE